MTAGKGTTNDCKTRHASVHACRNHAGFFTGTSGIIAMACTAGLVLCMHRSQTALGRDQQTSYTHVIWPIPHKNPQARTRLPDTRRPTLHLNRSSRGRRSGGCNPGRATPFCNQNITLKYSTRSSTRSSVSATRRPKPRYCMNANVWKTLPSACLKPRNSIAPRYCHYWVNDRHLLPGMSIKKALLSQSWRGKPSG